MTMWCFQCRIDYDDEVDTCVDCTAPTSGRPPLAPHEVGGETDEQLAYELNAWPVQARARLDDDLWAQNLVHAWMSGSLIVLAADEDVVDAVIETVDDELMPTFEPGAALVDYALDDYPDEARERVLHFVELAGVAHKVEGDTLVVQERDEDEVDELFDRLATEEPERLTFGPGIEGVDPLTVVQDVFVAADKLRRNPSDARARRAFLDAADQAVQIPLPWGYDARFWRGVLDRCDQLNDAVGDDDRDEVVDHARALRDALRTVL